MSVYVPTVERLFAVGFFWSMTMVTGMFSMRSTSGRPYLGKYCWMKVGNVSFSSRRLSAAIVSKQSDDLPLPDTPVKTVIFRLGICKETFRKLFSFACVMVIIFGKIHCNNVFAIQILHHPQKEDTFCKKKLKNVYSVKKNCILQRF